MTTPGDPDGDTRQRARLAVLTAVIDGDAGAALDVVSGLMAEGMSFESLLFEVIAPLQTDVGLRWQRGDVGIAEEHAVTGAIETLVALLAGSLSNPTEGRHVVVACAEGDTHSLPARMVAAYLLYLGWRVTFLGSSVPAADLGSYLSELRPHALVLSCAIVTCLPGARASIEAAHQAAVPVLAGGRGFGASPERAHRLGADGWVQDPHDIDEMLRSWEPDPAAAETGALDPTEDMLTLERGRLDILAEAVGAAMRSDGEDLARQGQVRTDLSLLFDAMLAALLVGDPGVMSDFGTWHRSLVSPTHGAGATASIVAALETAVAPHSPAAASYLAEARRAVATPA